MNNKILDKFRSAVKIKIRGKNVERFIRKLIALKIELLEINYINYKEVHLKVSKKDYEKILEIKTIYEMDIIENYGIIKIKKQLQLNKILIITLIIGIILLIFLSNLIFEVEVVHTNKEIRHLILEELENNNIKKYRLKKTYNQLKEIKKDILSKHKDQIEWLEIEEIGTKYQIRLEIRKKTEIKNNIPIRNVIAKKNAIIKSVKAEKGMIVKKENDYVKKGDVVISGNITLNDETKDLVPASGEIYGEIWYKTTIEYPLHYKEIKDLNNTKNVYTIKFLNKDIELTFKKFKEKIVKDEEIIRHPLLPIKLVKQHQREVDKIDQTYTKKEALKLANELARKKIESKLNDKEYIINQKNLKITVKDSKIIVENFFAVYENITDYGEIEEPKVGEENVQGHNS